MSEKSPTKKPLILILEGPAGSGKTWATRVLVENGFKLVPRNAGIQPALIRDYSYYQDDALRSQQKDLVNLSLAINYARESQNHVVIDRCLLSQLVYGSLRRKTIPKGNVGSLAHHLKQLSSLIARDYDLRRSFDLPRIENDPRFLFVILYPSVRRLNEQRAKTDKKYPFPAEAELMRYGSLDSLVRGVEGFLYLRFWNDTTQEQDRDFLLTEIEKKLSTWDIYPHVVFSP